MNDSTAGLPETDSILGSSWS